MAVTWEKLAALVLVLWTLSYSVDHKDMLIKTHETTGDRTEAGLMMISISAGTLHQYNHNLLIN